MAFMVGNYNKVFVATYDLSAYLHTVTSENTVEPLDTTTFGRAARTYIAGQRDGTLTVEGLFDGASTAADAALSGALGVDNQLVCVVFSGASGSIAGNRALILQSEAISYGVPSEVGGLVGSVASFQADDGLHGGIALDDFKAYTTTTTGPEQDHGGATTKGGVAQLHILSVGGSTPTCDVTIEHSTTSGSGFTTLATFAQATANTSERVTIAGTINQYTRLQVTLGGGSPSFTLVCVLSRT
jgi:hypothetical protein